MNNRLNSFVIQNKLINKIEDRKRFTNIVSVFFVLNTFDNCYNLIRNRIVLLSYKQFYFQVRVMR